MRNPTPLEICFPTLNRYQQNETLSTNYGSLSQVTDDAGRLDRSGMADDIWLMDTMYE